MPVLMRMPRFMRMSVLMHMPRFVRMPVLVRRSVLVRMDMTASSRRVDDYDAVVAI
jgi:hypothetical protein